MKTTSSFLCCALLSTLAADFALAAPVTVKVTGHVTESDGPSLLDGIEIGQPVTATYTYDTDSPDEEPSPDLGRYQPSASQASVRVSVGTLDFESEPPGGPHTLEFDINVQLSPSPGANWIGMQIASYNNKPVVPGAVIEGIFFDIWNWSGYAPASDALPTEAPDLQMFTNREINIVGRDQNSVYFHLVASIETAEIVPPGIEVSPATGNFLQQQQFDAALLLQPGSNAVSMQANAGGVALPLSYPGTCQLISSGSTLRPAILCPDAHTALAGAASSNIQWQVELADGTLLNETVTWRLIQ